MILLPDGRRVDALKVTELKKELELRGLSRSGAKKDLAARLSEYIAAQENVDSETKTETTDHHVEAETSQHMQDDHGESSMIEPDEETANLSTGTVIFVPKVSPAMIAPESEQSVVPVNHIQTGLADGCTASSLVDSDVSMLEASEVLDSSATAETEPVVVAVDGSQTATSALPGDSEARTGEQQPRRRNLWGARSEVNSGDPAGTLVVSFSTDTLEKMVPTLTSVDRKSSESFEEVLPSGSGVDTCGEVTVSMTTTAPPPTASSVATPSDTTHFPTPVPSEATSLEYGKEDAVGQAALPGNSITIDEEVVVMDATIEGGLDIEAPPVESQKPVTVVGQEEDVDGTGRQEDTRRVTGKGMIEAVASVERKQSPTKRKGLKETKAVGYLIDQPERVEACQVTTTSPCEFVHITCLVRPFTANQLKQMITTTYGPVADLWLNRIKSASVVQFESKEAAISCREGLDGSRWPSINPRVLRCDFVNQEFFNWMKQYGDLPDMAPPKHLLSGTATSTADPVKETKKPEEDRVGAGAVAGGHSRKSDDLRQKLGRRDGDSAAGERIKPSDTTTGLGGSQTKSEPSKMLDDLFRKTTASPCIYWLPLTEEEAQQQAAERAELAAKRGGTRATRSPFAVGGEVPTAPVDKLVPDSDRKSTGTGGDPVAAGTATGTSKPSSSDKDVITGSKPSEGRDSKEQKEQRRAGSPFMPGEKKSDRAPRPLHKPGSGIRDGVSSARRRKSSSSSSPSPKRLPKRPRPYREVSPRRRSGVGDYYRRRSPRSRSPSGGGGGGGGGGGRYRSRMGSSGEAYRRRRGSSPHTHRSRR